MKYFKSGALLILAMLLPTTAMATVYVCDTKQAIIWKDGKLDSENINAGTGYKLLQFNDSTGVLKEGYNFKSLTKVHVLEVLHKKTNDYKLIAIQKDALERAVDDIMQKDIVGVTTLQITNSSNGSVFLLTESNIAGILTGHCHEE